MPSTLATVTALAGPVGRVGTSPLHSSSYTNPSGGSSHYAGFQKTTNSLLRKAFISSQRPAAVVLPLEAGCAKRAASVTGGGLETAEEKLINARICELQHAVEASTDHEQMNRWVEEIRGMFRSMTDHGEITVSVYDTAWVALIPAMDGSSGPEFPKCLQWIVNNQLEDGSWGMADYFSYYDRILSTLASVVTLKTWGETNPSAIMRDTHVDDAILNLSSFLIYEQRLDFIQQNLQLLGTEQDAHKTTGFEMTFPAMMKEAKKLGLDLPYNLPAIVFIDNERKKKLAKIPTDVVHSVPTSLLFTLEGFHEEVDWNRMMKLQSEDGSFLNSPSSTAACLLHVQDKKAAGYLKTLQARYGNAVPNRSPVDLLERMWIVDRIQRLGIQRYLQKEIEESLDYVYRRFEDVGVAWATGCPTQSLDETAMGFRLLRQHGYDVCEDVFKQFETKGGEFVSIAGKTKQSVSTMFNFYRAAQTRFLGETLLADAELYARAFLEDKVSANECFDKWVIPQDLSGEVKYALATPWYLSLPRLETASYLKQYGTDDVWIGKALYRMPFVHNKTFLALAKAEYNMCQSLYEGELSDLIRWDVNVMNGASEEAKITFNGLHKFIADILGALQDGEIGRVIQNYWTRCVESMAKEAEWVAANYKPSFSDYLKVAVETIGIDVSLSCTLAFSGEPISDKLTRNPAYQRMTCLVKTAKRLINDMHGFNSKIDSTLGKANAVAIFMQENPCLSKEEAISKVQAMIQAHMLELVEIVHRQPHIPKTIKQAYFDIARVVAMLFSFNDREDYCQSEVIEELMNRILCERVL